MGKLCTNFNNNILEEMKRIVEACNKNGTTIQEVTFTNNSFDVCEMSNTQNTSGLLSVDLKVALK